MLTSEVLTDCEVAYRCHLTNSHLRVLLQSYLYHYHVTLIQRSFRGYYSRKYRHDFHARKRYLCRVVEKGNELRAKMQKYYEDTKQVSPWHGWSCLSHAFMARVMVETYTNTPWSVYTNTPWSVF
jgi:hypothetical protein